MNANDKPMLSHRTSVLLLVGLNLVFMAATMFPIANLVLMPLHTLVTALHEMGHATACLATGGSVNGLTIVSDHAGHGGLTWCRGGMPFIYTQTGYLGAAFFGCLILLFGRDPRRAKTVLSTMGVLIGLGTIVFMGKGLLVGQNATQELMSIVAGLALAAGLFFGGRLLNARVAHICLLIIGGQIALNALSDMWLLIELTLGIIPSAAFSDATNMTQLGWGPASLWSILWGAASVSMVWFTLRRWSLGSTGSDDSAQPK